MNEQAKVFSKEMAEEVVAALAVAGVSDLVAKTKADAECGTFKVCISTQHEDRQGEVIMQNGWQVERYMANPVVLFGHDYKSLPIGVATRVWTEGEKTYAEGRFASAEMNPLAQQVRKLYDAGILKATSVGFIIREQDGKSITKSELLEFSFVPVPANGYALDARGVKEMGLDLPMLSMKGFNLEVKETVAGELADAEKRKKKWTNLDAFDAVVFAFYNVYMDQKTEPEAFAGMVGEFIKLLAPLAGSESASASIAGLVGKSKDEAVKYLQERMKEVKADPVAGDECTLEDGTPGAYGDQDGALVCLPKPAEGAPVENAAEAQRELVALLKDVIVALREKALGGGTSEPAPAPKPRSQPGAAALKDLAAWMSTKEGLETVIRQANVATSEALAAIKTAKREAAAQK